MSAGIRPCCFSSGDFLRPSDFSIATVVALISCKEAADVIRATALWNGAVYAFPSGEVTMIELMIRSP